MNHTPRLVGSTRRVNANNHARPAGIEFGNVGGDACDTVLVGRNRIQLRSKGSSQYFDRNGSMNDGFGLAGSSLLHQYLDDNGMARAKRLLINQCYEQAG